MLVDSHCHLNFPDLASRIDEVMAHMREAQVEQALCVSVTLERFHEVLDLAERFSHVFASVGVHPDEKEGTEPTIEDLVNLAKHPKVVAIGETGLDYFRLTDAPLWQRERFARHICAAKESGLPLIVHTRMAAGDTLKLMRDEGAEAVGGVMHCFTEDLEVAEAAMDLGFYISFSGIITFKNATALQEVAKRIPLERMLVETDSPYLAPTPYRGKINEPAYVRRVAEHIALLRDIPVDLLIEETGRNFARLFPRTRIEV
ncbi:MAG: TatD family hydrolase [Pseudomonadota bacterium]|nr:TatD family hydrolase [Pseudomonadota bacterium]